MEELFFYIMAAFGSAWIVWALFSIVMVILWFILPIFVIMMNSKLKKINQNLVYIAEGRGPSKSKPQWDSLFTRTDELVKVDPVKAWLDKDDNIEVIDLTDVVEEPKK